ncbi:Transposase Tc1-like [Trinorchestia longiramus]|nr:Transposase Tc1-like [Trinorchestia longiramus]
MSAAGFEPGSFRSQADSLTSRPSCKPRTGHPRKINDRAARKLVRTVVQRPQTTREELKDDLKGSGIEASEHKISWTLRREGLCSRTPRRTPLLQKRHVKARLNQSPDMNPIENVWRELKLKIQKKGPNNITELKVIRVEEWNKIMPQTCKRLVVNYYKRLETIINNKGYVTKY